MEIYIVAKIKYWTWEGYDFPQILGIYHDPELAKIDFEIEDRDDPEWDEYESNHIHLLGPFNLVNRDDDGAT